MTRKAKTLEKADSAARKPLADCLLRVRASNASRWEKIEADFLRAMWAYDSVVADGRASKGDINNGKGDFFNDVLVSLIQSAAGKELHTRPRVPGLIFPRNNLDAAFPAKGAISWMLETKAVGVPRHPGNPDQPHPEGRPGSADIDKRIKEAAWKTIDIKGETAREVGQGGGATSDLATWIRTAPPRSFLCISARVCDERDLEQVVVQANRAMQMFDGVGLFCFGANPERTGYEAKAIRDNTLELDRVLAGMATSLRLTPKEPTPKSD